MSDRWKIDLKDGQITASPDIDRMQSFLAEAQAKLASLVASSEEQMILSGLPDSSLRVLAQMVEAEIERRK